MSDNHVHHHHSPLSEIDQRVNKLQNLLIEKGLINQEAMDELIDTYENRVGPQNGARVVARAWTDADYKSRLLRDATNAIREMGYEGRQGEHMEVVENTDSVHNLVVCTLCSCYPWPVLGLPPTWYKASSYRARAVSEPRLVLQEFGVELAPGVEVRVWDSTAEIRYLVLPQRPVGLEHWTAEQLSELVTRDSMIGVALVSKEPAV
ncbi:MAG: nitrile hydratase subunit alpha [Gammaproteobacteria bacterium]|nr:nitrile hydratase subunit alpha [Gammaproteobacteria bacterium]